MRVHKSLPNALLLCIFQGQSVVINLKQCALVALLVSVWLLTHKAQCEGTESSMLLR